MFNSKLKEEVKKLRGILEMQEANIQAILATVKDVFKDVQDEQRRIVSNITVGDSEILRRLQKLEEANDKRRKTSAARKNSKGVSGRVGAVNKRKSSVKAGKQQPKEAATSGR